MAQGWHIQLLGGFALTYDDRPVTDLHLGRSQRLLAYLILHRATAQPRQRLAFQLWPDSIDTQARTNLRKVLSHLRQTWREADQLLLINPQSIQWSPRADCVPDIVAFETLVNTAEQTTNAATCQGCWEKAIQLYQGDLLPDCDDDWLVPERERLRQLQQRSLEQLTHQLEQQQTYAPAITYAQQMLRLDGLNEAAYCTLMRLYHRTGDRANALQTYHQCLTVLRDELGVDPGVTTRKLYEQLLLEEEPLPPARQATVSPPPIPLPLAAAASFGTPTPLVGRAAEWATIQQWSDRPLAAAQQTVGRSPFRSHAAPVLLLTGEPGIGKTRLLEELRTTAQAAQAAVLWCSGFAAEMMRPYGVWIDALRVAGVVSTENLPPALGCLLPELGPPDQALPDPSHLFDAVVRSLLQWTNQAPLMILLDDIQWLDGASASLLHYLIRVLRHQPIQIACTARSAELESNATIADVLTVLRREQQLQTLALQPLDREQTRDLIRSTGSVAPSAISLSLVNQVFIDSGGNPLFALELARFHGQRSASQPHTLEALIGDRLQQLDDSPRALLPWAAALGRSFSPSTVAQVADYPITELLTAIEQLEQQSIICPSTSHQTGGGYDFTHDIVRRVVYKQLSVPRRQLVHQQIARHLHQCLAEDDTHASDVAHHASLGGDYRLATAMAIMAAEQSLQLFAYSAAREQARQGLEDAQHLNLKERILIQAQLLQICALAGVQGQEVEQLATQIEQVVQAAKSLQLLEAEVSALEAIVILNFNQSNFEELHRHLLQAPEASRIANPAAAAHALAHSGACLAEIGREIDRAEALLLEAQSLAERVGLESCDLLSGLGCVQRHYGRYDQARSQLLQAWQLAKAQADHWRECTCLSYLAMTALESGEPDQVFPHTAAMLKVAANMPGEGSEVAIAQALEALAHYRLHPGQTADELQAAIAELQRADAKRVLAYILMGAAAVDLDQSQPALAVERATAALQNAQIISHPSEIALSWAVLVQGLVMGGEIKSAQVELQQLQQAVDFHAVSALAQAAIVQAQRAL